MHRPALSRPLVLSLALLAAACGSGDEPSRQAPKIEPVPVAGAPQRGPADAWVTIVEFADFQCPYCEAAQPPLELLLDSNPEDVRLVFRHFPLPQHANALPAAIAAECAGAQGRFWEMNDALWALGALDATSLASAAQAAGVPDLDAWTACLATPGPAARVDADKALGIDHGVGATPTFFVNGWKVVGALSYDELDQVYRSARAFAVQTGVPRDRFYDVVVLGQ